MSSRFPGYDVLTKRAGLSWNDATRRVVDARLNVPRDPRFFNAHEWPILCAICDRIVPQPVDRPQVPLASYIDQKLYEARHDGYRFAPLLRARDAWRATLAALQDACIAAHGRGFESIPADEQDALLAQMQAGRLAGPLWQGMPTDLLFSKRIVHDIVCAYYAHPIAWSEIGWSGPAGPRGFVRMDADRRDPWEPEQAQEGREEHARRHNERLR